MQGPAATVVLATRWTLRVVSGPAAGQAWTLHPHGLRIGAVTGDWTLDDPALSAQHFVLEPATGGLTLRDLGSTNGTWVDGQRLSGAVVLGPGARFEAGSHVFKVERA